MHRAIYKCIRVTCQNCMTSLPTVYLRVVSCCSMILHHSCMQDNGCSIRNGDHGDLSFCLAAPECLNVLNVLCMHTYVILLVVVPLDTKLFQDTYINRCKYFNKYPSLTCVTTQQLGHAWISVQLFNVFFSSCTRTIPCLRACMNNR